MKDKITSDFYEECKNKLKSGDEIVIKNVIVSMPEGDRVLSEEFKFIIE